MKIPDTIRNLLEEKARRYNSPSFIEEDPVQIPHAFTRRENIEISGFLAASLAWGRRDIIIRNTLDLIARMDNNPIEFLMNMEESDFRAFSDFKHRTFNGEDCRFFIRSLRRIYREEGGLDRVFLSGYRKKRSILDSINAFRRHFLQTGHSVRSTKHLPDPVSGSAAKRLNLFLRWMVRKDEAGVDFGLWDGIDMADLMIPLDLHTGRVARELGILRRKQNDWKAVEELTGFLRQLDPADPVRYDYALFGIGLNENGINGQFLVQI
jgi:uncharacterized protein (TIGR02757 family)